LPCRARRQHTLTQACCPQDWGNEADGRGWARRLLQRTDWFTQEKACRLLTAALGARPGKAVAQAPPGPVANGMASSSSASAPPAAPPPQAESGAVQTVLVAFTDWLCSQLRRAPRPAPARWLAPQGR